MANTLLTVGDSIQEEEVVKKEKHFEIGKLLAEIVTQAISSEDVSARQEIARHHLGAISYEDVFGKPESEEDPLYNLPFNDKVKTIAREIVQEFNNELNAVDLEQVREEIEKRFNDFQKPIFNTVQISPNKSNLNEFLDNELITKSALKNKLNSYLSARKSDILDWIEEALVKYYTKEEIQKLDDSLLNEIKKTQKAQDNFVRSDGSISFTKPVSGKEPNLMSDLTTKRYVENRISTHENDPNAHGINKKINSIEEQYTKEISKLKGNTYTRDQIDKIVEDLVKSQIANKIAGLPTYEYINDSVNDIKRNYIKQDGSTPFQIAQSQLEDATEDQHLVTLGQLKDEINTLKNSIDNQQCYWITSGSIETTVGFFEDNSKTPEKMSVQEVFDRIFYQKRVSIDTPETTNPGSYIDVTVCVSDPSDVDYAEILVKENGEWVRAKINNQEVAHIEREEFEESTCVTRTVGPVYEDTEFDFRIYQSNGSEYDDYTDTKLAYPVFVGYIPKWLPGCQVTYKHLLDANKSDSENNVFYENKTKYMREVEHTYDFDLKDPVKLVIAVPKEYRNLNKVQNDVQTFGIQDFETDKFNKVYQTTFSVGGKDVLYKLYIYKQPLVRFKSDVTFKFL